MLTSLLATSDLAREVAARRHADAEKGMCAPYHPAVFCPHVAPCAHRLPAANWHPPPGPRPNPSLQNRTRNAGHPRLLPRPPCRVGLPPPPTFQPTDPGSAVAQTDDGLL